MNYVKQPIDVVCARSADGILIMHELFLIDD